MPAVSPSQTSARSTVRRVLVTGAFGFVGRWLIAELVNRDPTVEITAWRTQDETDTAQGSQVRSVVVDITDREAVFAGIRSVLPTAVIHLAAISAPREAARDPRRAWEVNLFGTANLAEAVLEAAPQARFIHVSSSEVYGGSFVRDARGLDETAPLAPLTTYALTKAAADLQIGKLAHEGLRAIRFRPFNHTGPGQSDVFVVPSLASQVARIERGIAPPFLHVGNMSVSRDILDVRDVARAYAAAIMTDDLSTPDIFNLASGHAREICEIADLLCAMTKVDIGREVDPARLRANEVTMTRGDAGRARAVLGWAPSIPLDETLRDVLDYWRQQVASTLAERAN